MTARRSRATLALALASSLVAASCGSLSPPKLDASQKIQRRVMPVTITGGTVDIHLATRVPSRDPARTIETVMLRGRPQTLRLGGRASDSRYLS